jgi:hypothetical protein
MVLTGWPPCGNDGVILLRHALLVGTVIIYLVPTIISLLKSEPETFGLTISSRWPRSTPAVVWLRGMKVEGQEKDDEVVLAVRNES